MAVATSGKTSVQRKPKALKKIERLKAAIARVDAAHGAGFTVAYDKSTHEIDRCIEALDSALAMLHLPPQALIQCLSRAERTDLASRLPVAPWSPETPHRDPHVCRLVHVELPDRFTQAWIDRKPTVLQEAKECAGIAQAIAERVKDAKRVALPILRAGYAVEVDKTGDLFIDRAYNPFADITIGEPFCIDRGRDVVAVQVFGYSPDQTEHFAQFDSEAYGIGSEHYPDTKYARGRLEYLESRDRDDGSDDSLYYRDGLFAIITTRAHEPQMEETCECAAVPRGHQYRDSSGKVHVMSMDEEFKWREKSRLVTYLGPAAKTRRGGAHERKRPAPRKARVTSVPAQATANDVLANQLCLLDGIAP